VREGEARARARTSLHFIISTRTPLVTLPFVHSLVRGCTFPAIHFSPLSLSLSLCLARLAAPIKMPDIGERGEDETEKEEERERERRRSTVIRDIVTRVHVVTVRIRDGVTRYALCTHVTCRRSSSSNSSSSGSSNSSNGSRQFPQSVPRCGGAESGDRIAVRNRGASTRAARAERRGKEEEADAGSFCRMHY